MNSIDRATLIDFALGRLEDAEAAALANRAERDSEFAQTLAALRQELASLDGVRPAAFRALPPRSPAAVAETLDAPETPLSADANDKRRVVFLDSLNPNAVKVRRVGPAYPYYADETAEDAQVEPIGEDATFDKNKQNGENGENAQALQIGEDATFDENKQNGENGENAQALQIGEDATFDENKQNGENRENGENAQALQINETPSLNENKQNEENGEDAASAVVRLPLPSRRRHFIPKFIATPRASRRSTFVAKKARFLDDASLANDGASNAASSPRPAEFHDAAPLSVDANAESTQNNDFESADVCAQDAVLVFDFNVSNEIPDAATPNAPTNAALQERERPAVDAQDLADATPREIVLENAGRRDEHEENVEIVDYRDVDAENAKKTDYQTNSQKDAAKFSVLNEEQRDATESVPTDAAPRQVEAARSLAERRLVELLGREPTQNEKEEYYWEPIDEDSSDETAPPKRRSTLGAPIRLATETTIAIGRTTLALCGIDRPTGLGADAFAATKTRRKRQPGKISDTMISTVSGLLIAVVVVWPLIRLVARDVLSTIAMSAVRKIGVGVPVSENAPQSDVLPLISEHIVFPRYESGALQPLDEAPLQETGTRSETPLFPVDSSPPGVDPASTTPTLEPNDAILPDNVNASLDAPF